MELLLVAGTLAEEDTPAAEGHIRTVGSQGSQWEVDNRGSPEERNQGIGLVRLEEGIGHNSPQGVGNVPGHRREGGIGLEHQLGARHPVQRGRRQEVDTGLVLQQVEGIDLEHRQGVDTDLEHQREEDFVQEYQREVDIAQGHQLGEGIAQGHRLGEGTAQGHQLGTGIVLEHQQKEDTVPAHHPAAHSTVPERQVQRERPVIYRVSQHVPARRHVRDHA